MAGGSGSRMGATVPKQFLLLQGKPVIQHSLESFLQAFPDIHFIAVLPAAYLREGTDLLQKMNLGAPLEIITGGDTRFQSVKRGLELVRGDAIIFVHDAVRCLVTPDLIGRCYDQALVKGNAIPAIEVKDSVRLVRDGRTEVLDRAQLRIIQTPQTFRSEILLPAFLQEYRHSFTDEATVVESAGHPVFLIQGEERNIKITMPIDILFAEKILEHDPLGSQENNIPPHFTAT